MKISASSRSPDRALYASQEMKASKVSVIDFAFTLEKLPPSYLPLVLSLSSSFSRSLLRLALYALVAVEKSIV